jgi:hypothetical protein
VNSTATKKLLRAAALAAVLVPLGSLPAEADAVTCQIGSSTSSCGATGSGGGNGFGIGAFDHARFGWDSDFDGFLDYFFNIFFDFVEGPFEITVTDLQSDPGDLNSSGKFALLYPGGGGSCVPIAPLFGGGADCVEFNVDAPPPGPGGWRSSSEDNDPTNDDPNSPGFIGYRIDLAWVLPTDDQYPEPVVLHDHGEEDQYDENITVPGSYYTDPPELTDDGFLCSPQEENCGSEFDDDCIECEFFIGKAPGDVLGDPGISGEDNSFSNVTVFSPTAVPEPATLLLVATGAGGVGYWRRRRTRH